MLRLTVLLMITGMATGCAWNQVETTSRTATSQEVTLLPANDDGKVELTEAEWRERLTPEQFRITREKGTERAFTGAYYDHKGDGTYHCICCGAELFDSTHKYRSGTGWPSYWQPSVPEHVGEKEDRSFGMVRTEVICSRCDAHLGHVFNDGPEPTGLRYCINSAALQFEARDE